MNLTAERFSDLIASLDALRDQTSDQRRQPRVALEADATIIPLGYERPGATPIIARDLSSSGFGFLHNRQLALDEQFALVLPQIDDNPAIVLCEVAFWQPMGREIFAIGARFVRLLREANTPLPIQVQDSIPRTKTMRIAS
jgi:hypothetical protein